MGLGGAGDGALGIAAMMRPAAWRCAVLALAAVTTAGCSSVGGIVGAVTGTAAAFGSGNPAVGAAVGVGTRAAADYGLRYVSRRWHTTEQDSLAATMGAMEVGEVRRWEVRHDLPFGNAQGELRLVRAFDTPLARCKEALFSVAPGESVEAKRQWFVTSACEQAEGWKWAAAEPATERWGSLH